MKARHVQRFVATAAGMAVAAALVQADQIRRQQGPAQVPMEIALKAGGDAYNAKGEGSCTHAPKASIYGTMAEMWTVRHEANGRSVQLTLWKPSDGSANMFSLSVNGAKSVSVSTVRGGQVTGTGTVSMAPSGKGGTFTIDAKARTGEAYTGTITCDAFTPAIAEGGN